MILSLPHFSPWFKTWYNISAIYLVAESGKQIVNKNEVSLKNQRNSKPFSNTQRTKTIQTQVFV